MGSFVKTKDKMLPPVDNLKALVETGVLMMRLQPLLQPPPSSDDSDDQEEQLEAFGLMFVEEELTKKQGDWRVELMICSKIALTWLITNLDWETEYWSLAKVEKDYDVEIHFR